VVGRSLAAGVRGYQSKVDPTLSKRIKLKRGGGVEKGREGIKK
jgi:hypothetical protein